MLHSPRKNARGWAESYAGEWPDFEIEEYLARVERLHGPYAPARLRRIIVIIQMTNLIRELPAPVLECEATRMLQYRGAGIATYDAHGLDGAALHAAKEWRRLFPQKLARTA